MAARLQNTAMGIVLSMVVMGLTGCPALFMGAAGGAVAGALYYKGELKADRPPTAWRRPARRRAKRSR